MAPRPDDPDDATSAPGADAPRDGPGDGHEPTEDERWAAIVADLADLDAEDLDERWPGLTDDRRPDDAHVVRPAREPEPEPRPVVPPTPPATPELTGRDWDGTSQYDEAEARLDAQDHFEPPDPGPVLGGDPLLTMAWFAAAGMPLFLLVVLIFWQDAPIALVQSAAVVFVLGVAVLVWRMPQRRDGDGHDKGDGAVV
jgi:hypothetical protein